MWHSKLLSKQTLKMKTLKGVFLFVYKMLFEFNRTLDESERGDVLRNGIEIQPHLKLESHQNLAKRKF